MTNNRRQPADGAQFQRKPQQTLQELSLREMLARNMRIRRNQLYVSQEQLAFRCGLHRTYIGAVERAERNVSADNIEKIAKGLRVSVGELLCK